MGMGGLLGVPRRAATGRGVGTLGVGVPMGVGGLLGVPTGEGCLRARGGHPWGGRPARGAYRRGVPWVPRGRARGG